MDRGSFARSATAVLALCSLAVAVACVSRTRKPSADADGGSGPAREQTANAVSQLRADEPELRGLQRNTCALFERCFAPLRASIDVPGALGDNDFRPARCEELGESAFDDWVFPALLDSVASGRVIYHRDELDECMRADAARECTELSSPLPACSAAFEGTVELGDRCATQFDCGPDAFCDLGITQAATCPTVCKPRSPAGAACFHPAECVAGTRCFDPTATNGLNRRCEPPTAEGEPCTGQHCGPGLVCAGGAPPLTCQPLVRDRQPGEPCSPTEQCANGTACRRDASGTRVCTAESAGQGCTLASECAAGEFCGCTSAAACGSKQCLPWPREGEPCAQGVVLPTVCAQGLFCQDGTCRARLDLGEPCNSPASCASTYCIEGRCASGTDCL